jgi:hypothetical protein
MCFSAEGSFVAGTGLLVAGAVAVRAVLPGRPRWLPLALLPVGFAVQQLAEGAVWLALQGADPAAVRVPALAFLFFSHGFWLFWVPFAVALIEPGRARRGLFAACAALGLGLGALMYVSIFAEHGFSVQVVKHSVDYGVKLASDGIVPRNLVHGLYASVILVPLLGTSNARVRAFGVMVAASMTLALLVFMYAFASIWCFMAAVL